MDFHLDKLLNLPNVTVLTCYQKEGFTVLKLDLLNLKVSGKIRQSYGFNTFDSLREKLLACLYR